MEKPIWTVKSISTKQILTDSFDAANRINSILPLAQENKEYKGQSIQQWPSEICGRQPLNSCNSWRQNVVNGIIKRALRNNDNNNTYNDDNKDVVKIYIKIKYSGEAINRLIKKFMKKFYKCFSSEKRVKFVLEYETARLSHFTKT